MRYWVFIFFLSLFSFGLSGALYFSFPRMAITSPNGSASLTTGNEFVFDAFENQEDTTLLFVGDIMLSRSVGAVMRRKEDYSYPFRRIAEVLGSADITFGNLEGPISSRGEDQGSIYSFRADPRVVQGLEFAGFDVLSLANNHIMDWGAEALEDTIRFLREKGIMSVGAGMDERQANEGQALGIHRNSVEISSPAAAGSRNSIGTVRVAFLAYTNLYPEGLVAGEGRQGVSDSRLENIVARVRDARNIGDIVVVSYHWGEEYKTESNESQKVLARAFIDAGADLVIGHHPHVAQEIEKYKNGWIAYSLGNFVFDQDFSEETMKGLMLRVFARDGKISRVEKVPILLTDTFQPYVEIQ